MDKQTGRSTGSGTRRRADDAAHRQRQPEPPADKERIRVLAYEIYETRRSSGMLGDPVSDWLEAERRLREPDGQPGKAEARRKPSRK